MVLLPPESHQTRASILDGSAKPMIKFSDNVLKILCFSQYAHGSYGMVKVRKCLWLVQINYD